MVRRSALSASRPAFRMRPTHATLLNSNADSTDAPSANPMTSGLMPTSSRPGSGVARGTSATSAGTVRQATSNPTAAPAIARTSPSVMICATSRIRPGAERLPQRQFGVARQRSRQQQVADVDARDEEHEARRPRAARSAGAWCRQPAGHAATRRSTASLRSDLGCSCSNCCASASYSAVAASSVIAGPQSADGKDPSVLALRQRRWRHASWARSHRSAHAAENEILSAPRRRSVAARRQAAPSGRRCWDRRRSATPTSGD